MIGGNIKLDADFFGKKTTILAQSGYGKSYTGRVVVEEGLKLGVPFIVIDPQGAYDNIPQMQYIQASRVKDIDKLGMLIAKTNRNVVLQIRDLPLDKQSDFVRDFIMSYRHHQVKGIKTLIIDECHKFAPEYQKTSSKEYVVGLFQEDRSLGLGAIAISQRSQRIDKTILSQSDYLFTGKVTAAKDLQAIEQYLPKGFDSATIKKQKKGEFLIFGLEDEPVKVQVRKSTTNHSGDSPKNLLTENKNIFTKHLKSVYKSQKKMSEKIDNKDKVKDLVPSKKGVIDLVSIGAKMSLGSAVGGAAGMVAGAYVKSPIPMISSRTLASGTTSLLLYAGYRKVGNEMLKDTLKYAAAGSFAFTAGSFLYDVVAVTGFQVPAKVGSFIGMLTGVSMNNTQKQKSSVDTNTSLA